MIPLIERFAEKKIKYIAYLFGIEYLKSDNSNKNPSPSSVQKTIFYDSKNIKKSLLSDKK